MVAVPPVAVTLPVVAFEVELEEELTLFVLLLLFTLLTIMLAEATLVEKPTTLNAIVSTAIFLFM